MATFLWLIKLVYFFLTHLIFEKSRSGDLLIVCAWFLDIIASIRYCSLDLGNVRRCLHRSNMQMAIMSKFTKLIFLFTIDFVM